VILSAALAASGPEGGWLYWSDAGTHAVRRVPARGGEPAIVESTFHVGALPSGLAADARSLYWYDRHTRTIERVPLDGGVSEALVEGVHGAFGLAIDAGTLFWTAQDDRAIRRRPLDGGPVSDVITGVGDGAGRGVVDLAVDPVAHRLYWTEVSAGLIEAVDEDGSDHARVAVEPREAAPLSIAVDARARRLYWADFRHGVVRRAALDSGAPETVGRPSPVLPPPGAFEASGWQPYDWTKEPRAQARAVAIDERRGVVYAAEEDFYGARLVRWSLTGGRNEVVLAGLGEVDELLFVGCPAG
jgi:sugar lactone lactonase YvrE